MEAFFTADNILDPQKIQQAGYLCCPYPEYISGAEVKLLMHTLRKKSANIWMFEFGGSPVKTNHQHIDDVARIVFEDSYKNLFIAFKGDDCFVWMPEGQDHFIILGTPEVMAQIASTKIFGYSFSEFVSEDCFSKKKIAFLKDIQTRYTISTA